jgi:hypothetical protein
MVGTTSLFGFVDCLVDMTSEGHALMTRRDHRVLARARAAVVALAVLASTLATLAATTQSAGAVAPGRVALSDDLPQVTNTVRPTVTGSLGVGSIVTAVDGEWSEPTAGLAFSYQWCSNNGAINGATDPTYKLTGAEAGKLISVIVTAKKAGFRDGSMSSIGIGLVAAGSLIGQFPPTISGPTREGQTLTADSGTWSQPNADLTFAYAWSANGAPILGATHSTYDLTPADVGKKIRVLVTASEVGYKDGSELSAATGAIDPVAVTNSTPPSIGSAAVVGRTLTANAGLWAPTTGVTFHYEWLSDGTAIPGAADSANYMPDAAQVGHKISVEVTGQKADLTTGTATSNETSAVTLNPPVFGTPANLAAVNTTASTMTLTWTKSTDAVKYRIYYGIGAGTRTKVDVKDVSTVTVTGLKPGTTYSVDISAFKKNGTQSAYNRPRLNVTTADLTAPTGLQASSRTSTSVTFTWTKVPGVKAYQLSSGVGVDARTSISVGDVATATVSGLKVGTSYSFDIASLSADKKSKSPASAVIDQATSSLLAPANVIYTRTATTITISWTKSVGADHYRIFFGLKGGARSGIELGDVGTHTIAGLTKGKTYQLDVAAIDADVNSRSAYSPLTSVKTG